ncbi:MAG TPA: 50S ribosomal protein L23 [Opitutales bacterium]|jgi:large subunit ribosomal protein L23|nr:50S ribosomal protein L23 [Opitutales bacterium]
MKEPIQVLKSFRITEKASALNAHLNKYVFEVATSANRIEVGKAITAKYKTKVARVNILNHPGKRKSGRMFGGFPGRTNRRKIAIVTLAEGQKIETM